MEQCIQPALDFTSCMILWYRDDMKKSPGKRGPDASQYINVDYWKDRVGKTVAVEGIVGDILSHKPNETVEWQEWSFVQKLMEFFEPGATW